MCRHIAIVTKHPLLPWPLCVDPALALTMVAPRLLLPLPLLCLATLASAGWETPNGAFRELMKAALTSLWDFSPKKVRG